MGLLMTASWLFYPTLAPANALQCASKYTKELYAEGDVMMSELGKDDDPGICIPACKNKTTGRTTAIPNTKDNPNLINFSLPISTASSTLQLLRESVFDLAILQEIGRGVM